MRNCLVGVMIALLSLAIANTHDEKVWLLFLMRGDGARPTDSKQIEKLQSDHIAHLIKAVTNHGYTAGPLQDPTEQRRGIVVLRGEKQDQVEGIMAHDPFCSRKIMFPQAMEWKVDHELFNKIPLDPSGIKQFTMVLFRPGKSMRPVNEKMMKDHAEYMSSLRKTAHMAIYGDLNTPLKYRGAAIFDSSDKAAVESALQQDFLVKSSLLELEIMPLWLHKDTFKKSN